MLSFRFKQPVLVMLLWCVAISLAALANYVDLDRRNIQTSFAEIWGTWFWVNIPFIGLSYALLSKEATQPVTSLSVKKLVFTFVLTLLIFAPINVLFQTLTVLHQKEQSMEWGNVVGHLQQGRRIDWVVDATLFVTTFTAVSIVKFWNQIAAREKNLQQAITDNLNLRLELEQQKLNALRAQLEPHFLFNALNAISALVRQDDKRAAITALNRLSELLRYALSASSKEWVCIDDELRFIEDYLSLQKLRYGERLMVGMTGDTDAVRRIDCPPLLLQPLLENALRHDLDCRKDGSEIEIRFLLSETSLQISMINDLNDTTAPNPGLGLGLRNTVARLELLYNGGARLQVRKERGKFLVQIALPTNRSE